MRNAWAMNVSTSGKSGVLLIRLVKWKSSFWKVYTGLVVMADGRWRISVSVRTGRF